MFRYQALFTYSTSVGARDLKTKEVFRLAQMSAKIHRVKFSFILYLISYLVFLSLTRFKILNTKNTRQTIRLSADTDIQNITSSNYSFTN